MGELKFVKGSPVSLLTVSNSALVDDVLASTTTGNAELEKIFVAAIDELFMVLEKENSYSKESLDELLVDIINDSRTLRRGGLSETAISLFKDNLQMSIT